MSESGKKRINYKWIIIALCFLMTFTCLGFCSSSKSIFILPVCEGLDISRTEFSVSDSFRYVSTAIINVFFSVLIRRLGAKLLILLGIGSLMLSSLIASLAQNAPSLYISSIFLGLGIAWTTTTMVGFVVNLWCKENKGTIMGVILASNGIGGALAVHILTPVLNGGSGGFRDAYRLTVLILAVLFVLILLFFKNKDSQTADQSPQKKKASPDDLKKLLSKPEFFVALGCIFIAGAVLQGVSGVAVPIYSDAGIDALSIANIVSVTSVFLSVTKLAVGFIYDKRGVRFTSSICYFSAVISLLLLVWVSRSGSAIIATACGLFRDLALPLETVMLPIYARELFGEKYFNTALGIIASVNTAGYAVGGPIANACFDILGSYDIILFVFCALMLVALIALLRIIRIIEKNKVTDQ
ncbi:MAG: MFS transporter [Ruminococcaceae bacterium]|nr:MFS transporter [Oscillospiraceae bacterium]